MGSEEGSEVGSEEGMEVVTALQHREQWYSRKSWELCGIDVWQMCYGG